MEWGQQMRRHEQVSRDATYHNTNYMNNREKKIPLTIDIEETNGNQKGLSNSAGFSVDLIEPLIIDELSDIYLDSCLTKNTKVANTPDNMAFVIKIDQLNINSRSNNSTINGGFLIPNENTDYQNHNISVPHKSKKMNYICSINPTKLSQLTGTITNLAGEPISSVLSHYVGIAALAEAIPTETTFTIGGFTGITSTNHAKGATDFYFEEVSGTAPNFHSSQTFVFASHTDKATVAKTHIEGLYPRMILELLIVNRSK